MKEIEIAFIGGSGLYKIPNFKNSKWIEVSSNFGKTSSKNMYWITKWQEHCLSP